MKCRAAVLHEMGSLLPYEKSKPIRIEEIELDPPGAGEVLVKIAAAGLCHSDLSVVNGSRPRPLPMVIGHEASGVVEQVGHGVTGLAVGVGHRSRPFGHGFTRSGRFWQPAHLVADPVVRGSKCIAV